jgi:1,4-dihydroxy-2-naphthoate polyprenyltransferase
MTPSDMGAGIRHLVRALRLPFITASLLPYACGTLLPWAGYHPHAGDIDYPTFARYVEPREGLVVGLLGLFAVGCTHLSANLLSDLAGSRSGADRHDRSHYSFLGGSRLIREGILSERFYAAAVAVCAALGAAAIVALAIRMTSWLIPVAYALVLLLAWSHAAGPLRLSYRGLGEIGVFLLFGPVCVLAGYLLQTGLADGVRGAITRMTEGRGWQAYPLLTGTAFGFIAASVLVANKVPDATDGAASGKRNLVTFASAQRGFMIYMTCVAMGLAAVAAMFWNELWRGQLLFAQVFICALPAVMAACVLRRRSRNETALPRPSKLAISAQIVFGLSMLAILFGGIADDFQIGDVARKWLGTQR